MTEKFEGFVSCILCDKQEVEMEIRNGVGVCIECIVKYRNDTSGVGEAISNFLGTEDYGFAVGCSHKPLPDDFKDVECSWCGETGFTQDELVKTGFEVRDGYLYPLAYSCNDCIGSHPHIFSVFFPGWCEMVRKVWVGEEPEVLSPEYVADFWLFLHTIADERLRESMRRGMN